MTNLRIQRISDPSEISEGIALYREVFEIPPSDCTLAPRLLIGMAHHGQFVLAARDGDTMVGFAYGFPAIPDRHTEPYLYLQLIVVRPDHQNSGTGRALMNRLAQLAADHGLRTIRWAFDPLDTRNAHFYLDVIGARAGEFVRDMYGSRSSAGNSLPSHRVIAYWKPIHSTVWWPRPHIAPRLGTPHYDQSHVLLTIADRDTSADRDPRRERIIYEQLERLISCGCHLVSCQRVDDGAVARLMRPPARGMFTYSPAATPAHTPHDVGPIQLGGHIPAPPGTPRPQFSQ